MRVIKPVIALDRVAQSGLKKTDIKITPSTCVHLSLVLRQGHSSSTFWPTIVLCDWYQPLQLRATQHYIIIITNSIFAIWQWQHELQRWSLINIPRKKNTRRTRDRIDENNVYLVLTKTDSLLYPLQAYLWSTPLVILGPPFPLITLYREQLLPWLSPVSYLESRGHQRAARSFYEYLKWLVFEKSPRKKGLTLHY